MAGRPDSVDWFKVPGYPGFYEPGVIEPGLRGLAEATNLMAAARATTSLDQAGLVHGHSGAAMPAAAFAAPFLLDVLEHGHDAAKVGACGLLEDSMRYDPLPGYTRVPAAFGPAVPICCAVAHHVHSRRDVVVALGPRFRDLLVEAAPHWSFEVGETADDGGDTIAFGTLRGKLPVGRHEAECHSPAGRAVLGDVRLELPADPDGSEVCVRLFGVEPGALPARAVLLPAECGRRVH
ncbi:MULTISPECIES: hypothetical protein [Saccharothrix]|uniref:hypothetical protein n=1 Tax=Saccharothrix TaxID=2071 RepID=UPI00093DF6D8|nr:hypothetical protein [Saccharothrix sp. CB00851]OKI35255.1 hypothetical protein A6A25_24215 [Saccharothrix sp. CB00851]